MKNTFILLLSLGAWFSGSLWGQNPLHDRYSADLKDVNGRYILRVQNHILDEREPQFAPELSFSARQLNGKSQLVLRFGTESDLIIYKPAIGEIGQFRNDVDAKGNSQQFDAKIKKMFPDMVYEPRKKFLLADSVQKANLVQTLQLAGLTETDLELNAQISSKTALEKKSYSLRSILLNVLFSRVARAKASGARLGIVNGHLTTWRRDPQAIELAITNLEEELAVNALREYVNIKSLPNPDKMGFWEKLQDPHNVSEWEKLGKLKAITKNMNLSRQKGSVFINPTAIRQQQKTVESDIQVYQMAVAGAWDNFWSIVLVLGLGALAFLGVHYRKHIFPARNTSSISPANEPIKATKTTAMTQDQRVNPLLHEPVEAEPPTADQQVEEATVSREHLRVALEHIESLADLRMFLQRHQDFTADDLIEVLDRLQQKASVPQVIEKQVDKIIEGPEKAELAELEVRLRRESGLAQASAQLCLDQLLTKQREVTANNQRLKQQLDMSQKAAAAYENILTELPQLKTKRGLKKVQQQLADDRPALVIKEFLQDLNTAFTDIRQHLTDNLPHRDLRKQVDQIAVGLRDKYANEAHFPEMFQPIIDGLLGRYVVRNLNDLFVRNHSSLVQRLHQQQFNGGELQATERKALMTFLLTAGLRLHELVMYRSLDRHYTVNPYEPGVALILDPDLQPQAVQSSNARTFTNDYRESPLAMAVFQLAREAGIDELNAFIEGYHIPTSLLNPSA